MFDYRIKRLEERGIITGYQARTNITNSIYGGYLLLIQTINITQEKENEIFQTLKRKKLAKFIGKIGGNYDIIIGLTVSNLQELQEHITFVNNTFGKYKTKMTVLTMIEEIKDSFKPIFTEKDELIQTVSMPKMKHKELIDQIDEQIMNLLAEDGTLSSPKIASKVKRTDVSVRERIKKLLKRKLILGFRTMIDLTKLEQQFTYLMIKTNPANSTIDKSFQTFLQMNKQVTYACKLIGESNYIVTVYSKNNQELNGHISKLRDEFHDSVTEVNSLPLFGMVTHKHK